MRNTLKVVKETYNGVSLSFKDFLLCSVSRMQRQFPPLRAFHIFAICLHVSPYLYFFAVRFAFYSLAGTSARYLVHKFCTQHTSVSTNRNPSQWLYLFANCMKLTKTSLHYIAQPENNLCNYRIITANNYRIITANIMKTQLNFQQQKIYVVHL